jgi:hypothetical protein
MPLPAHTSNILLSGDASNNGILLRGILDKPQLSTHRATIDNSEQHMQLPGKKRSSCKAGTTPYHQHNAFTNEI